MNVIEKSALAIVLACDSSVIKSIFVVFLFYYVFNTIEAMIERLVFGERFEHFLDPIFIAAFVAYAGLVVYYCAMTK